ncbi:MAG: sensor signal transduction histidine kinase [Rariglobus sp.]|jgi:PAS domain S-box-containing protein|nr:sensor signal transduction histidine kinase [Rariglobus sp.]
MKRASLVGFLLLAVLAVFYLQRKVYSNDEHERFHSGLSRLKRLDSAFNEDLLRVRFSLLGSYDVFLNYQEEMEQLVDGSLAIPSFVGPDSRADIEQTSRELAALLQTRRRSFERFKSLNAVLSNSRRYFPVAVDELTRRLTASNQADQELGGIIQTLTRVLFTHTSSQDPLPAEDLATPGLISAWSARHPDHTETALASSLAQHARTLLDGQNELNALTRQLLSLPTAHEIDRLSQLYEKDLTGALRRTGQYRELLYALVLVLAGVIGYALWALRASNHSLEQRVSQRTADLQRENAERQRAETELANSLSVLQATLESTADGIVAIKPTGEVVNYNTQFVNMWGLSPEVLKQRDTMQMTAFVASQVKNEEQFVQRITQLLSAPPADAYDVIELKDGRTFERYVKAQQVDGKTLGMVANFRDVTARRQAEIELGKVYSQLLDTSRQAGMAEVATGVLHNVGNVLNSVNVSATLVADQVRRSKVTNVGKLSELLGQHREDLASYLVNDPKGRIIPAYLATLSEELTKEKTTIITELESLQKNIGHIKDIVAMQQSYAKTSGVVETVSIPDLIEDALRMNAGSLARHDVDVVRDYHARPVVTLEKNKVLQTLVNLVRNAKYACDESGRTDKLLTIRTTADEQSVTIAVIDNGVGIPAENLTRIFAHGFTTRKHGHGFGLHSGALAVKELGGSLTAHSDGAGRGATFILKLPYKAETSL